MPFLEAFRDLAMEELARTTCPNVEDLKDISKSVEKQYFEKILVGVIYFRQCPFADCSPCL